MKLPLIRLLSQHGLTRFAALSASGKLLILRYKDRTHRSTAQPGCGAPGKKFQPERTASSPLAISHYEIQQ